MINANRNKLSEYIYSLYDKGLMEDYSNSHFLIRAMKGDATIISDYVDLFIVDFSKNQPNFATAFLINFSCKLKRCADVFTDKKIESFVKEQLSAGKTNYRDEIFFEALSEINVLFYFCNYVGNIKEALYEPKQGVNGANPEARFIFEDDMIIDIEVKKANFSNVIHPLKGKNGLIKPNIILEENVKDELEKYCLRNELQLVYPRVSKIADFIKSAASKFQLPTSKKHFNILFINWTYTDFPECGVNEPLSILMNTENGLFYNNKALSLIKNRNGLDLLSKQELDKISAIILYRDTLETLLSGDFRFHFKDHTFRLLLNHLDNEALEFNYLCSCLKMNPHNDGLTCEWYPFDYKLSMKKNALLEDIKMILLNDSVVISDFEEIY